MTNGFRHDFWEFHRHPQKAACYLISAIEVVYIYDFRDSENLDILKSQLTTQFLMSNGYRYDFWENCRCSQKAAHYLIFGWSESLYTRPLKGCKCRHSQITNLSNYHITILYYYEVGMISRLLKIIGLFGRILSLL